MDSQRLSGLFLLESIGAPTPEFSVIRSISDLHLVAFKNAPLGWTIRSCRSDGIREMGLFYKNYVAWNSIPDELISAFNANPNYIFYIIYPSWHFEFSCNVVKEYTQYTIEGKFGSQKTISMGREGSDFYATASVGSLDVNFCEPFIAKPEIHSSLIRIITYLNNVSFDRLYAETALTKTNKLIFYELFDLDQRAF